MSTEYVVTLSDELKVGLAHSSVNTLNQPGLYDCANFRPTKEGLEPVKVLENPFTTDRLDWPHPMIYEGKACDLLLAKGSIHAINKDVKWTTSKLCSVAGAGTWSVADFVSFLLLSNGTSLLMYNCTTGVVTEHDFSYIPKSNYICNFRGQLICGGIKSSWYDADTTFAAWSRIGSINCTPAEDNVRGYAPLQVGEVYAVSPIGKVAVAYGSEGVCAMLPVSEPVVTFGLQNLKSVGCAGLGCVGFGKHRHIMIGEDSHLWNISEKLEMEDLDYFTYIRDLDTDNVVITYDRLKDDFYISDGTRGFILSPVGLSYIDKMPTSVYNLSVENSMAVYGSSGMDEAMLVTNPMDFGSRGKKTIGGVDLGINSREAVYVAADWRNRAQDIFVRSPWKRCSPAGYAMLNVTGVELRLCIRSESFVDFKIDYAKLGIYYHEQVNRRGHVNTTVAGANQ